MAEDGPRDPAGTPEVPIDDPAVRFELYYDGPEYDDHDIDLELFVHSLGGLSRAISRSSKLVDANGPRPRLRVSEDFKKGSFGFEILVLGGGPDIVATLETLGFIAGTVGTALLKGPSAIEAIKKIAGRRIDVITSDDGSIESVIADGEVVTDDPRVARVVADPKVRSALTKAVSDPLRRAGTTEVRFADTRGQTPMTVVTVTEAEAPGFATFEVESTRTEKTEETRVRFVRADVEDRDSWRVFDEDEGRQKTARMADGLFFERVCEGNEPNLFAQSYRAVLTMVKTTTPGRNSRTEWRIEHIRQATRE